MPTKAPLLKTSNRLKRRVRWFVLMLSAMALYFPINRLIQGGVSLESPIDKIIPLLPVFIVPYIFGVLLFVGLPLWAAFRAKDGEFEAYALCILLATLVSCIIYLVFPTYVNRPEVLGQDLFSRAIALLYQADQVYNAAPSGHTFYSVLSAIFLTRWKPLLVWVWFIMTILILASTLLTRQHNLWDLVWGLALAILVYALVDYRHRKKPFSFAS
jgi:membrane-associated phospholipid phosphatase